VVQTIQHDEVDRNNTMNRQARKRVVQVVDNKRAHIYIYIFFKLKRSTIISKKKGTIQNYIYRISTNRWNISDELYKTYISTKRMDVTVS
jgi:hypothetical protein